MKLILPLISVTLLLLVNALPSDATTSYLNLLKKTREKNTSLSGKTDQEVMLAMMDQYNKRVNSIATPSSTKNEKTVKMSARMPAKTVAASQPAAPVVQASQQQTSVNLAASIPVTATATDSSSQQEVKSGLRPMHLRTIGLAEKHISKSGNSNSIKPLSASIPTSATSNAQSKTLAFTHDPTISFGMMNNQAVMNPSQMQAIQQQQHQQQQQQQQAALQMQQMQMQPGFAMNGFDQTSALANLMLQQQQQQQQQQQLMMQNPTQQYAYGHQSLLPSNGVGVGGGANYFQSNLFSNNPLRKGNELNKARKELLTDPKFLKDQPKLSNFLFAKYLKEVSTDDEEEEKEEPVVKAPTPVRKSGKRFEKGEKKTSTSSETPRTPKSKVNKVEKKVEEEVNKIDEKEAEIEIEEEVVEPPKTVETKPAEVEVKKSSSKQEQPQQQQQQQETAPVSKSEAEKKEKKEKKSGKNEEIKKLSARIVSTPTTRYMGSPEMDDLRNYINTVRKEWTQNSAQ